jgi:parvulin-like peptidyl-prolyl isomerase
MRAALDARLSTLFAQARDALRGLAFVAGLALLASCTTTTSDGGKFAPDKSGVDPSPQVAQDVQPKAAKLDPAREIRARHILVGTEKEAKGIIAELKAGGDFATIAKAKSTDRGSAGKGGDLGYFTKGQMVPEFEAAAFALRPGQFTEEPVKTQYGWHIIKVEDRRN